MEIIPSILVQSAEEFTAQIHAVENTLNQIQLDIADGKFVPNTTWAEPATVKKEAKINVELHLMVEHPIAEIKKWKNVPQVKRALFHFEAKDDIEKTIAAIHANGWEASIVLNPDTPVGALDSYLDKIEGVMFMGVYPGFQGQKFIPQTIDRIKEFKAKKTNHFVELDGAVNEETLPSIVMSGVDAICPGSAVWQNGKPAENIKRMREIIDKLTQW
ncbi:MAG: ribulose-phosphate 3-epimerase [Patescibacteria group bacterium]